MCAAAVLVAGCLAPAELQKLKETDANIMDEVDRLIQKNQHQDEVQSNLLETVSALDAENAHQEDVLEQTGVNRLYQFYQQGKKQEVMSEDDVRALLNREGYAKQSDLSSRQDPALSKNKYVTEDQLKSYASQQEMNELKARTRGSMNRFVLWPVRQDKETQTMFQMVRDLHYVGATSGGPEYYRWVWTKGYPNQLILEALVSFKVPYGAYQRRCTKWIEVKLNGEYVDFLTQVPDYEVRIWAPAFPAPITSEKSFQEGGSSVSLPLPFRS
jgi:hypothetical protein